MTSKTKDMQAKLCLTGEAWVDEAFNQIIAHSMRLDYKKVCETALSVINHPQAQLPDQLRAYMVLALSEIDTDVAVRHAEKLVDLTMAVWGGRQQDSKAADAAIILSKNVLNDNKRIAEVQRKEKRASMQEKGELRTGPSAAMGQA